MKLDEDGYPLHARIVINGESHIKIPGPLIDPHGRMDLCIKRAGIRKFDIKDAVITKMTDKEGVLEIEYYKQKKLE